MLDALLGRKIGMTQVFGPNGTVVPVTIIEVGPCFVTQVKTVTNDGYEAVQIGFEQTTNKHSTRPELGHLGHSLPLLKGQRKALQTHQQSERTKAKTDTGTSEVETATEEITPTATSKQVQRLLKI